MNICTSVAAECLTQVGLADLFRVIDGGFSRASFAVNANRPARKLGRHPIEQASVAANARSNVTSPSEYALTTWAWIAAANICQPPSSVPRHGAFARR